MTTVREKSFRRSISALDDIFEFLAECVAEFKIVEAAAYTLQFAVEEVFTNLVKYDSKASPAVPIRLSRDDKRITVEVINAGGEFFDMTSIDGMDDTPASSDNGGLGLRIVRKMVDEFRYDYSHGTGIITIVVPLEE